MLSQQILAVRFGSIGDVLLATPLLRAIRARHPGARLTVLTYRRHAPLLLDNPHVDEVIGLTPGASLLSIAARVRASRFSYRLDLDGGPRSRLLRVLAPGGWQTAPRYTVAREVLIRTKRNIYPEDIPLAERYFDAAKALDVVPDGGPAEFFLSDDSVAQAEAWLAQAGLGQARPFVAFAPGASRATKRWPLEHWVKLVRRVTGTGADAIVVGGADDTALAADLAVRSSTRTVNAAGALSVQMTGAVLKRSAAVITGQTGAMHMAAAVGTPLVALVGPTVRAFGGYPYNAHRATVLERSLSCRPCSRDGSDGCPLGHHFCMREIQPEAVFSALCRTLA